VLAVLHPRRLGRCRLPGQAAPVPDQTARQAAGQAGRQTAGRAAGPLRGFTIVEIMVALTILSILLMLGVPAFATYLQNAKLRSAAESLYAGVQLARAEAVRRNVPVQIVLTNDIPGPATAATANLGTSAPNWLVRAQNPVGGAFTFIEGKSGLEGTGQGAGSTPTTQIVGSVASITFNGFGRANAAATFDYSNPTGGACAPTGPMRCLRIVVAIGGQARLCDPAATAAADTRKC